MPYGFFLINSILGIIIKSCLHIEPCFTYIHVTLSFLLRGSHIHIHDFPHFGAAIIFIDRTALAYLDRFFQ